MMFETEETPIRAELAVASEHLTGEMLLVDLGSSVLVSDHPETMGGTGKGPTPGELVKGALAVSALQAAAAMLEQEGISAAGLMAACASGSRTRRHDGQALPSVTTLGNFEVRLAIPGSFSAQAEAIARSAAENCPVALILRNGCEIAESDVFRLRAAERPARSSTHLLDQARSGRPDAGHDVVRPVSTATAVRAEYIGKGRCLVGWAQSQLAVVDEDPEQLLLAGLCACTSVFVARAAAHVGVDVEIRVVARASRSGPFAIDKQLAVTGQVGETDRDILREFAETCAIGETLRAPGQVLVAIERVDEAGHRGQGAAIDAAHFADMECDDGACCVPDFTSIASRRPGEGEDPG